MRVLLIVILLPLASTDAFNFVCYYTNWAQYRPGEGRFLPEDIDPNLCTHIIYAFAKPVGLDIQPFEHNDDDTPWSKGMYSRVIKLKERNPNLKVLLAVGGWNMASAPFIPIVQTQYSRETFARNTVNFLRKRNFDGLDVDWEYPGDRGSTPSDKPKFQLLMETLRRTFEQEASTTGRPCLLLTAAVAAGKKTIDNAYEAAALSSVVDFLNIMTYDFHGAWENTVGFNSPLYPYKDEFGEGRSLNVDWAARYWTSPPIDKKKINIGIATYGRSFTLANPSQHSILSPSRGAGHAQKYSREAGIISFYEVCEFIKDGRAHIVDVPSQGNRYAVKGDQWVGYDDPLSVYKKTCYARNHALGGVMFWNLDFDDFSGKFCNNGTYPLIRTSKGTSNYECDRTERVSVKQNMHRGSRIPYSRHSKTSTSKSPWAGDHFINQLPVPWFGVHENDNFGSQLSDPHLY